MDFGIFICAGWELNVSHRDIYVINQIKKIVLVFSSWKTGKHLSSSHKNTYTGGTLCGKERMYTPWIYVE